MTGKSIYAIREIVDQVRLDYPTGSEFTVAFFDTSEVIYLQHSFQRYDTVTRKYGAGYGRKWHISPHATESEIVLTCLKAVITNVEHEVRENFLYNQRAVFQPHQDIQALWEACETSDARPPA